MNKTVQITLRAIVIKEFTETLSVPMGATEEEMQAYARDRLHQVPVAEFRTSTEAWKLESAKIQLLNEPPLQDTLRAALDEQGKLCAYNPASKREDAPAQTWPRGTFQAFWVRPAQAGDNAEDAWLFEVRDHYGNLLADRLIRGRRGLNLFYEDMVGYQPDSDEYRHDLESFRDEVLEMFYRHTTNDPN